MKATVVTITQELAKDYLKRNNQNRKVKKTTLNFYKNQMRDGNWKENGEPIIIDVNGVIKDGQHRLMAVAETGYAYRVPVISGISTDVMDTIDTGTNRTASDILELEGFKYASLLASFIKIILSKSLASGNSSAKHVNVSNSDILKFAESKKEYLELIAKEADKISSLQVVKILTSSILSYYIYTYGNTEETRLFLKNITGTFRKPKSATDYVFKKLTLSKTGDHRLSLGDKQAYIERAYLYYTQGNPEVKSFRLKNKNKS